MTYNTKRRPKMTAKQRAVFLDMHNARCCWCGDAITDDAWDVEHELARELGGSDEPDNLRPIHRDPCHRAKTAIDIKAIAKSNRIRRANGPAEQRKKKQPIRTRATKWPKRSFPKRQGQ